MLKDRKREHGSSLGGHLDKETYEREAEKIGKNGSVSSNTRKVLLNKPPSVDALGFELDAAERKHFRNITKLLGGFACELDSFLIALAARQLVKLSNPKQKAYRSDMAIFLALCRDMGMTPVSRMRMIRKGINDKLFDMDDHSGDEFDSI